MMDEAHFKSTFGFTIVEFEHIHHALRLPDPVRTREKDRLDSKTALLMYLAWLRGSRLLSLEGQFGWSAGRCSRFNHHVSQYIFRRWGHLIDVSSPRHRLLTADRLDVYAAAIERKTGFPGFWGAVDGTVRPIAYPDQDQRRVYNGHKRLHALKWQFVTPPDGILFCSQPFDGSRHDAIMVQKTLLVQWAVRHAQGADGEQRYLYGDKAYANSAAIITPFKGNRVTPSQEGFNHIMSKYRITVEWGIGKVSMQWSRFRDKQWQRTALTPCGCDWMVSVLLYNALSCLVPNQISISMACRPPTLEEYFSDPCVRHSTESPDPVASGDVVDVHDRADDTDEEIIDGEL